MDAVYRVIDHTADVAIEAEAPDLAALFDRCAAGMFSLIVDVDEAPPGAECAAAPVALRLGAFDRAELLVAWLRELLWLHHERGWLYTSARFDAIGDTELVAEVRGRVPGPDGRIIRELKAVTYHGLVAEPRDDGWFARIVFDV